MSKIQFAVVALVFLTACGHPEEKEKAPAPVQVTAVALALPLAGMVGSGSTVIAREATFHDPSGSFTATEPSFPAIRPA